METTIVYWGYLGIMEKKMEATTASWGYLGMMEKKMEATVIVWVSELRVLKAYGLGFSVSGFSSQSLGFRV